ncbi:MAG: acyl-homoserine-lactone synthase [bacterium]
MFTLTEGRTSLNFNRFRNFSVSIQEGSLIVKNIITEEEKIQAYRLRHRVFCEELCWLPQREDKMEIDNYDKSAVFFGVFDNERRLLAFLRVITPEGLFMIEREFSFLVRNGYKIRKQNDTVEISRLCVAPESRNTLILGNFGFHFISVFLYKGVYHWCIRHKVRYLYFVVELKIYRLLRSIGFPCKIIGKPKRMPDGVIAIAGIIDRQEFEALNAIIYPERRNRLYAISINPCSIATATA